MTGEQLNIIIKSLRINEQYVAEKLGYTRMAVVNWIHRDNRVPDHIVPSLISIFTAEVKHQRVVLDSVLEALVRIPR